MTEDDFLFALDFSMNIKCSHILFVIILVLASFSEATGKRLSPDSLTEGLSCENLSTQRIYQSIRSDAWTPAYHLPQRNWSYSAGLYDLAACWSLARAQRLFFYLARWGESVPPTSPQKLEALADLLRGSSPYANYDDFHPREFPLKDYFVFSQNEGSPLPGSELLSSLEVGFQQPLGNDKNLKRTFKSEIEFFQNRRFHDFIKNARFIVGDGARPVQENRNTRNALLRNLEENKLTLLLLRPKRTSQHIVLAKSFSPKTNGDIEVEVYDSNVPHKNQVLLYSSQDHQFYGPEIVQGLPGVLNPQAPLGVYIVDEKERSMIEATLAKHYQSKCRN